MQQIKNVKYNFCIVNRYENGESNMGMHADDDEDIDQSVPICSGMNQRNFQKKMIKIKKITLSTFFYNFGVFAEST